MVKKMYKIGLTYERISDTIIVDSGKILYENHLKKNYSPIQESLFVIALDAGHKILFFKEMFKGSMNETLIDPKILFFFLIKIGSFSFIIAHNHPAGDMKPSTADRNVTERIKEGGEILGLPLLDHIIFNDECYFSFLEQGLIDRVYENPIYCFK
jgi:DNA repair protein RadC